MLKLFEIGNAYIKQSDWKDLALVKACLFSMGILTALVGAPVFLALLARRRYGFGGEV